MMSSVGLATTMARLIFNLPAGDFWDLLHLSEDNLRRREQSLHPAAGSLHTSPEAASSAVARHHAGAQRRYLRQPVR